MSSTSDTVSKLAGASNTYAQDTLLGAETDYPNNYTPSLLQGIEREKYRATVENTCTVEGIDRWVCYELSWLGASGKPEVAVLTMDVPADSPRIVESKSLKLYLNSINTAVFESPEALLKVLISDIGQCLGNQPYLTLEPVVRVLTNTKKNYESADIQLIDGLDVVCDSFQRDPLLLNLVSEHTAGQRIVTETLVSHLFRSNCPVTNQPDWASVFVSYTGPQIESASLLKYLVSYREHAGFHEQCIEQIFADISQLAAFSALTVEGRFTRRGGIEINPCRSIIADPRIHGRLNRQ